MIRVLNQQLYKSIPGGRDIFKEGCRFLCLAFIVHKFGIFRFTNPLQVVDFFIDLKKVGIIKTDNTSPPVAKMLGIYLNRIHFIQKLVLTVKDLMMGDIYEAFLSKDGLTHSLLVKNNKNQDIVFDPWPKQYFDEAGNLLWKLEYSQDLFKSILDGLAKEN